MNNNIYLCCQVGKQEDLSSSIFFATIISSVFCSMTYSLFKASLTFISQRENHLIVFFGIQLRYPQNGLQKIQLKASDHNLFFAPELKFYDLYD